MLAPTGTREVLCLSMSTSCLSMAMGSSIFGLESSTTMAVISLVSEAIGTWTVEFFSSSTLPVPSSTTSTDCEPSGTASAAAVNELSNTATIFLSMLGILGREECIGRQKLTRRKTSLAMRQYFLRIEDNIKVVSRLLNVTPRFHLFLLRGPDPGLKK